MTQLKNKKQKHKKLQSMRLLYRVVNWYLNDEAEHVLVFINWFPKLDDVSHWIVFVHVHDIKKILVAIEFELYSRQQY